MLVAFLIYYEFWWLVCLHVVPDVFAGWSWERGGAKSGRFVILSCLVVFVVAEDKFQRDFCYACCTSVLL